MDIYVVLNQKGGVGKTTIATNLCEAFKRDDNRVLLIDADGSQGSAMTWADVNEGKLYDVVSVQPKQLENYLERNSENYDVVIVDCPPRADADTGKLIRVATMVLIPVQPSPYDIWACADLVEILQARKEATKGLPGNPAEGRPYARFVISRADKRTNIVGEALEALQSSGIEVLDAMTTEFVAYKQAAKLGQTVFDTDNDEAKRQIRGVKQEIERVVNDEH